jgi:hypothetical protein
LAVESTGFAQLRDERGAGRRTDAADAVDAPAAICIDELLTKFADQNVQLAVASPAEKEQIEIAITLDWGDFTLFRLGGNRPLRLATGRIVLRIFWDEATGLPR